MIAAILASIALGLVIMYPLMLVIAATLVGCVLFSIVHRLRTGRWPKGRQARPQPGRTKRARTAGVLCGERQPRSTTVVRCVQREALMAAPPWNTRPDHYIKQARARAVAALHAKHSEG